MVQIDKQSYTFPAQPATEDLCYSCDEFDESKCKELDYTKGYCNARKMPLYNTGFTVCLDYKKKKELKE